MVKVSLNFARSKYSWGRPVVEKQFEKYVENYLSFAWNSFRINLPSEAEVLRIDLRSFGGVNLEAKTLPDVMQLLMINLVVLSWTFACLTRFPAEKKLSTCHKHFKLTFLCNYVTCSVGTGLETNLRKVIYKKKIDTK